jgi:hypothetical protein
MNARRELRELARRREARRFPVEPAGFGRRQQTFARPSAQCRSRLGEREVG